MTVPANITRFLFEVPGLGDELRVVGFAVEQAMSCCFRCEVELACENAALDLASLVGKVGVLTLFDLKAPQYLHGEVTAARQEASGNRFTTYRVMLEPKLSFLGFRSNLRIFQAMSVPDIVQQVLNEAGIKGADVRIELHGHYPKRSYCTQFRETDLSFVERLLAEEGIFYFFEHSVERHILVLGDSNGCFKPIAGRSALRYKQRTGQVTTDESVWQFESTLRVSTGKTVLRDYNFEKSRLLLEKDSAAENFNSLENYQYPGHFMDPGLGKRYADLRLQAQRNEAIVVGGSCDCVRLQVGRTFRLEQHPCKDFNAEFLLTGISLQGRQPQSLEEGASAEGSRLDVMFRAIPSLVAYRPALRRSKPWVEGCQTAFVTGPQGEEIYTDQYGRIKIQFHWDREGGYGESASCWVRVSQGWAGNQWGSMVIPRIGQEVIVSFMDGDPDQPIVTGTTYNGANPPPYPLPANNTRTTFKSLSSSGGGGYHELRIDDKKGQEEIFLHGEKDLDLYVKNDAREWIGNERHLAVQNDQYIQIKKDQHISVGQAHNLKTGKTLSRSVGGDQQIKISGSYNGQAGQVISLKAGMTLIIEAGTELTLKAGGGLVKLDPSGVTIKGPIVKINSGGAAIPAQAAVPVAPVDPEPTDKGEGPGQISALALKNTRKAAEVPAKAAGSNAIVRISNAATPQAELIQAKGSQALKAKVTEDTELPVANCTLSVVVQRSDLEHKFANATVEIHGPSGRKEGKTTERGSVVFSSLLPGLYSVEALLADEDKARYSNPKPAQITVKANTSTEIPLQLSMRKVVIDLNLLGSHFAKHSQMFDGLPVTLKANGKVFRGTLTAGRFECEVPSEARSFELSFADNQGITYINTPTL